MRRVEEPDAAGMTAAAAVVRRHLRVTPTIGSPVLGDAVELKLETFQPTGSFKVRGGLAAVAAATERGVGARLIAASAGNHGLGVAFAAARLGADATVVVADNASEAKVAALAGFPVELVRHGSSYDEAEAFALDLAASSDRPARFVSPYNDPDVIAGQATLGEELLAQIAGMATVVAPVGGGGLLSGMCLATQGRPVRIVGVEPEHSASMTASLAAGHPVPVPLGPTIADGLAGNLEPGSVTVDICARCGVEMLTVSEEEIRSAIRFLAMVHGLVVEGGGATAVAALLSGRLDPGTSPTAVIVTGRNIEQGLLSAVLAEGDWAAAHTMPGSEQV